MRKKAEYKLEEISQMVNGQIIGDKLVKITSLCSLDEPTPDGLSFSKSSSEYTIRREVEGKKLGALIISRKTTTREPFECPLLLVDDPYSAILSLFPLFFEKEKYSNQIHSSAVIDPTATIGTNVTIGAFCVVGPRAKIGDNVVLHPHVVLYRDVTIKEGSILHSGVTVREECTIGSNNIIQNGAVIGADGFGYVPDAVLGLKAVPQVGSVSFSDKVEVGANSCIDRATLGQTKIGHGSKVDNLVQIGHNVKIGTNTIICGHCAIGGSTTIEDRVIIGGDVGIRDHITIGSEARVAAKSGVTSDLKGGKDYAGFPIFEAKLWRRANATLSRLAKRSKEPVNRSE